MSDLAQSFKEQNIVSLSGHSDVPSCLVTALLNLWLDCTAASQDTETAAYIGDHSYNELVSLMVDRLGNEATTGPGSFPGTQATEPEPSPEPHSERSAASEGEMQSSSARPFIPNSSDADTRQMEGQAPAVGTSEDVSSLSQSIQASSWSVDSEPT